MAILSWKHCTLAPFKEAPNLVPDSSMRPADILIPNWSGGRPAALDIHVISPLQQQIVVETAFSPGHALSMGVRRKLTTNLPACRSVGIDSIPLVTETLGGLAEDTIHTLRTLGKAIGQRSCSLDPSLATKHLFARFAIALWRGNASMWLHRQPTLPPALDGLI